MNNYQKIFNYELNKKIRIENGFGIGYPYCRCIM